MWKYQITIYDDPPGMCSSERTVRDRRPWPRDQQAGFPDSLAHTQPLRHQSHKPLPQSSIMDVPDFETLKNKVVATGEFLRQQHADLSDKNYTQVKATQLGQMLKEILSFCGLTIEQGTVLTAIVRNGPWESEDRAAIAGAVSNAVANCGSSSVVRRPNQDVLTFAGFLSAKDMEVLNDKSASLHVKADQVATRLIRVQLWLASEQGYKEIVKVVMAAGLTLTSADEKYNFLQTLKKLVRSKSKRLPKITLPDPFPAKPQDMVYMGFMFIAVLYIGFVFVYTGLLKS